LKPKSNKVSKPLLDNPPLLFVKSLVMNDDFLSILGAIEKPLLFASRTGFQNINKVKDLDRLVQDLTLKALTLNLSKQQIGVLRDLGRSFEEYSRLSVDKKKELIKSSLRAIIDLKIKKEKVSNISQVEKEFDKARYANDDLSKIPIQFIKGVGPRISKILSKKGISSVEDALYNFPRKYEDRRRIKKISSIIPNTREPVMGRIISSGLIRSSTRPMFKVVISDGTGAISLIWYQFNMKYLRSTYKKGYSAILSGDITLNNFDNSLQIIHPIADDIEVIEEGHQIEGDMLNFNRIVPIYPLTEGIKQRRMRRIEKTVIDEYCDRKIDFLPPEVKLRNRVIELDEAISRVHFPSDKDTVIDLDDPFSVYDSTPHRTISFHEFFLLELGLALKKRDVSKMPGIAFKPTGLLTQRLFRELPFDLTPAQERVLFEIEEDMRSGNPMNRLLQGDVGSGKTIVALISILKAVESGYQSALMAPTEILAEQHLSSVLKYVEEFGLSVVLLKSGQNKRERDAYYNAIKTGEAQIVVGTHALIQERVEFNKLGFVVIDEQHRFGVIQRASLRCKGSNPDVLVMTATPIPRTLAMTAYGDLDVSVLDEMPPNRQSIKTLVFHEDRGDRKEAYDIIRKEVDRGRQVYIVYPLIEESENTELRDIRFATQMFEELKDRVFPEYRIGLLHGRLKSQEKDDVMKNFVSHEIDILVSTTVIEVGVDVPNATVMMIENAERFGLSQLHQLRGRVGRSEHESLCILISMFKKSEDAQKRLSILSQTTDGFKIAEADLTIRGPGDFIGTKQSGLPELRFASLLRDSRILGDARKEAFKIVKDDPTLERHPELYKEVLKRWGERLELASIS